MNEELVRVTTASNQAEAEMWRGLLANEGIDCLVRNVGSLMAYTPALSPHELYTRRGDAESARDLLAAYSEPDNDATEQGEAR